MTAPATTRIEVAGQPSDYQCAWCLQALDHPYHTTAPVRINGMFAGSRLCATRIHNHPGMVGCPTCFGPHRAKACEALDHEDTGQMPGTGRKAILFKRPEATA